jgi:hypothetical protein
MRLRTEARREHRIGRVIRPRVKLQFVTEAQMADRDGMNAEPKKRGLAFTHRAR